MRITAYVDEDVPLSFAEALRNRGVDCITTQEAGNKGLSDREQLAFSAGKNRAIVTHNKKDFILLHNEYARSGTAHSGIVVADQLPVGQTLRRFMKLWFSRTTEDMANRLEFLSNWK
jgi:predicted nuclease of predicted toxin-antitoxin system